MGLFTRKPLKYAEPLTTPLTAEQAGLIARRLTDEHILDVPTVDDIWRLMDTISMLYLERDRAALKAREPVRDLQHARQRLAQIASMAANRAS